MNNSGPSGPERAKRIFRNDTPTIDLPNDSSSSDGVIDTADAITIPQADDINLNFQTPDRNSFQKTSAALLQIKAIGSQLIRGDEESKRLIIGFFQEELEERYLKSSIRTDDQRIQNLGDQIDLVNKGLSKLTGKNTSLLGLYNKVSQNEGSGYPPLKNEKGQINAEGIFGLLRYHQELARKLFSASEIASEGAEIDVQKALVPLREELNRITINERKQTAIELFSAKGEFVGAEEARGEILSSQIRGRMIPIITAIAEAPVIFLQAPVDRLNKWMSEADDKAVPIAAVFGAIAGPILTFTVIPKSSLILNYWLSQNTSIGFLGGIFFGSLGSVAIWKTTEAFLPLVAEKLSELKGWLDKVGSKWKENAKENRKRKQEEERAKRVEFTSQKDKKGRQE